MKVSSFISFLLLVSFVFTNRIQAQSFSYPGPVCPNSGNIAPVTSGGFQFGGTFSSGAGLNINSSTGVINTNASSPGSYTVVYTSANPAISATITINPLPPPVSISGQTICSGSGNTFTLMATSADPNMTYSWLPSGNSGSVEIVNFSASAYSVVGTVNGCTTMATVQTSVVASVTPAVSGPTVVCEGAVFTLTASGAQTYTWSSGALSAVMTETAPLFPGLQSYTVFSTDASGCTGNAVHQVMVNQPPSVSIVANPTVCAGYAFSLTATGANSYTWNTGQTTSGITVTPQVSSTYTVTGAINGCTNIAFHSVNLVPLPVINVLGNNTVCAGSAITFTASGQGGPLSYTWSSNGSNADTLQLTMFFNTTFTLWGGDLNGCIAADIHTVSVFPRPNIVVLPATNTLCSGSSIIKTAINATTYTWSTGATTNTVILSPKNDTVYSVTGMNNNGCLDTETISINVFPTPTVTVNSPTMCSGETATIEASAEPGEGLSYLWQPAVGNSGTVMVSPIATSKYTVTALVGPCLNRAVSTVSVIKTAAADVAFRYEGPFCNGNFVIRPTLSPDFTKGGEFYSMSDVPVDASSGAINLSNVNEGLYSVNYSVAAQGCTLANASFGTFLVNKTIHLTGPEKLEILPGNEIELNHSGGAEKYQWYPAYNLSCVNCEFPLASPLESTQYCVKSTQNCVVGTCILVEVLCVNYGDLSVPNAFTPNNDGRNDRFCLEGWVDCNMDFYVAVFDRWGTLVYESTKPDFCWDGTRDGQELPTGVYVYKIVAQFRKEQAIRKSGNISLIR